MSTSSETEALFRAKYEQESAAITRLIQIDRAKLGTGSAANLKLLGEIATRGLQKMLARRRSTEGRDQINELVNEFILFGAKAVLLTGSQRGGDFLNNQLRGHWAERVALSMPVEGLRLVAFGPSGAAMPGEEDHRQVIMTFKEIHLLEGKRPDLLAFDKGVWEGLPEAERTLASTWPKRRLEVADEAVVKKARRGLEVKNSTWHYGKRRAAGGGPLSITVKEEEVADFKSWSVNTGLPVIFVQVLFDELYCMSFSRMEAAINRGCLYEADDYLLDRQTGGGGKVYHKFHLTDFRHRCGKVVFPDESTAELRVLEDGNVVPFINFQPAQATDIVSQIILDEIAHVEPASSRSHKRPRRS
jgi:hypothetical protein